MAGVRGRAGSRRRAAAVPSGRASASTPADPGSATPARSSKFNANGRHVGNVWCASEAEAIRYEQLLQMQGAGIVAELRTQVAYPLTVNGVKVATYRADHVYLDMTVPDPRGELVIEEVKGLETPEWKLKCKLFHACYPELRIRVIGLPKGEKARKGEVTPPRWPAEYEEQLRGQKNLSGWIRVRYAGRIPE